MGIYQLKSSVNGFTCFKTVGFRARLTIIRKQKSRMS